MATLRVNWTRYLNTETHWIHAPLHLRYQYIDRNFILWFICVDDDFSGRFGVFGRWGSLLYPVHAPPERGLPLEHVYDCTFSQRLPLHPLWQLEQLQYHRHEFRRNQAPCRKLAPPRCLHHLSTPKFVCMWSIDYVHATNDFRCIGFCWADILFWRVYSTV